MKVKAHVKAKHFYFGSLIAQERFFERAEGKDVLIEIDEPVTKAKRRYFEGCIVPTVFYTHPHSGWESFAEAREALKLEFLGKEQTGLAGEKIRISRSTTELNNKRFGEFLEAITAWLKINIMVDEMSIDPEEYKRWRDSAPSTGEIYPPLKRLKEVYDREKYGKNGEVIFSG